MPTTRTFISDHCFFVVATLLVITFNLCCQDAIGQLAVKPESDSSRQGKPEILTAGFFDVLNSGQINASARFLKINIGEPSKFHFPVSVYSGVSSNSFPSTVLNRNNDVLINNFINPAAGIANACIDEIVFFDTAATFTRLGILYQLGERLLSGNKAGAASDPGTGKPVNFMNAYAVLGVYVQTGAWEEGDPKNMGMFWMAARYIACRSSPRQLRDILPDIETNGFYHGYSFASGVRISNFINVKVVYYSYVKAPEMEYALPLYQFSCQYNIK